MQRFILPALGLVLLGGCSIGPQFDQQRPVSCTESSNELNALATAHQEVVDAGMKGEASIAPSAAANYLAGDYPGVVTSGGTVRTLDYWSAVELRTNDVRAACAGK